jgi:predicted ATPase/DNA-binding SARP family transcriptional activator
MSANEVVPAQRLIEDVWDGAPPSGAAATLQSHVSWLRRVLGPDRVEFRDGGYVAVVAESELDSRLFESEVNEARLARRAGEPETAAQLLREALGRWRDDAYADAAGMAWVAGEATRLGELRAGATEDWLNLRLELGDHASVVADAELVVAATPLREGLWAALMLALYRCGRQSEALRAYQRLSKVLDEELGIEPSTALRELEDAILLQKSHLDWHERDRPAPSIVTPSRASRAVKNLPVQLSSFLGRDEELATGGRLLAGTRLLSVTGPGGIGKTRVAYQMAIDSVGLFPDGVWIIELASLSNPELVPGTLMITLGLLGEPSASAAATVVAHLRDRQVLVVLDNCEHLIDAVAALTNDLLRGCPRLRVLATSRQPLRVAGESVWMLGPLALPEPGEADSEVVARADSVALFCERAAHAKVGFALTAANAGSVRLICERTEGLPLAIELAAARVRSLSLIEIADRLGQDSDLLSKGPRGESDRHSSMRTAIAWSHELLNATEQILFRRLAIFAGGFSVAGAEAICAGDELDGKSIIDALDSLVDNSLVIFGPEEAGGGRYQLLEVIRAYAVERLRDAGEEPSIADRHATWYLQLAVDRTRGLPDDAAKRLDREQLNLLAALDWLAANGGPVDHGRLVNELSSWWDAHGQWQTGRHQLRRYLDRGDRDRVMEGRCLGNLGLISSKLGQYPEARSQTSTALAIARQAGDGEGECRCLAVLGDIAWMAGDLPEAQARLGEARDLSRKVGDRQAEISSLQTLGNVAIDLGDFSAARARYEEALTIARELGHRHAETNLVGNLGLVAGIGDQLDSRAKYTDALRLAREHGFRREEATSIGNLGDIANNLGEYEEARARCEEALALSRELGDRRFEGAWIGVLGEIAYNLTDFDVARTRAEEALAISRQLGERIMEVRWQYDLGNIATDVGDYSEARARYLDAVAIVGELDTRDIPVVEACAELLARVEQYEQAVELLAAADNLSSQTRCRRATDQVRYEAALALCRDRLGADAFATASSRGRSLDWESVIKLTSEGLESAGPRQPST